MVWCGLVRFEVLCCAVWRDVLWCVVRCDVVQVFPTDKTISLYKSYAARKEVITSLWASANTPKRECGARVLLLSGLEVVIVGLFVSFFCVAAVASANQRIVKRKLVLTQNR